MHVAVLLFDHVTALDAVGPYEVLSRLPNATVRFVAAKPGPQTTDTGFLTLVADYALEDVSDPDILVVPGGPGTRSLLADAKILEWIRTVHTTSRWTTSVCTGALLLGSAGLLNGLSATTHWASRDRLSDYGARPVSDRIVQNGKIITAAGVSAGIDLGLRVAQVAAGAEMARAIQLVIEYDPQAALNAGSSAVAGPDTVALAQKLLLSPFAVASPPPARSSPPRTSR